MLTIISQSMSFLLLSSDKYPDILAVSPALRLLFTVTFITDWIALVVLSVSFNPVVFVLFGVSFINGVVSLFPGIAKPTSSNIMIINPHANSLYDVGMFLLFLVVSL